MYNSSFSSSTIMWKDKKINVLLGRGYKLRLPTTTSVQPDIYSNKVVANVLTMALFIFIFTI